jgi:UDP:flavonoid glycosyltransferase YjiC (YdhE family)
MARILCAWELGLALGHLTRLAPTARALKERGHVVLLAVRDVGGAASVLGPAGLPFVQAPFTQGAPAQSEGPANYAELLLSQGWHARDALWGLVYSWLNLFRTFRPDLLVVDHSPSALLAARAARLPCVQIGNGFEIPPAVSPLPSIRVWERVPEERLARSEQAALATANAVLGAFKGPPLERLAELFDIQGKVYATFAELDHYGERAGVDYAGPVYSLSLGTRVDWPLGAGPRVFAYLRPTVEGVEQMLGALADFHGQVICAALGFSAATVERFESERFRLVRGARTKREFAEAIERLVGEARFREQAAAFAEKYRGFDPDRVSARAVEVIEQVLQSSPGS